MAGARKGKLASVKQESSGDQSASSKFQDGLKIACEVIALLLYGIYSYTRLFVHFFLPPKMKPLDGEIFLITGSSTGIGREVVLRLARYHPKTTLVLWDFNSKENEKTAADARAFGARVHTYEIDVSDRKLVDETAKKVREEVGDVSILYNNAGIAKIGDFFKVPAEDLEKIIQVNLISHFWTLRAFMPKMIENNHGHIVTTASLGAYCGMRHCIPYFASKFAIRGYIESLQDELFAHPSKPTNIKFTTIFPAFVQTPMTTDVKLHDRLQYGNTKKKGFLKPDYVAEKIIEGIQRNQEKVMIPKSAEFFILFKSLVPSDWFVKISRAIMKDEGTVIYPENSKTQ